MLYNLIRKKEDRGYKKMTKALWFDMDGTFVDLYGVKEWLPKLIAEDASPYKEAKPLCRMATFARLLNKAQKNGYTINIVSWASKKASKAYEEKIAEAKKAWLAEHLPSVKWNAIKVLPYGTNKSTAGQGVLFDDEEHNREEWKGTAYHPNNMLAVLRAL